MTFKQRLGEKDSMIASLKIFVLPIIAYLLGSIPWGLILTKRFTSHDIRKEGSGNIGATNVRRVAGTKLGLLTLVGDVLKGGLPVYLAVQAVEPTGILGQMYVSIVGLAAFCGHLYPLYTGLKGGGKGVATAWGCFMIISPWGATVAVLVFVMMICLSNRVSIGSLSAAGVLPVVIWKTTNAIVLAAVAAIITVLVFFRHKENIVRIFKGTEPIIWKD